MSKNIPIVVIGGGGHASVLVDILLSQNRNIISIVSPNDICSRNVFKGLNRYYDDNEIFKYKTTDILLVNGIGMMPKDPLRKRLSEFYINNGYQFATVICESAKVSKYAEIHTGAQLLTSSIVQAGTSIGQHTIVNSRSLIEHDCNIGSHNHIAPSSTICGQVVTGDDVFIGAGSIVIQNSVVSSSSFIRAGSIHHT